MANTIYNALKHRQLGDTSIAPINFKTDTIKIALVTSAYTPNKDTDNFWDDVVANEVANSGTYSAGGATLTVTTSQDDTDDEGVFDAVDVSFTGATITAKYAVIYKSTGVNSTSPLICCLELNGGSNLTSTAGTFTIPFAAEGILNLGE